MKNLVFVAVFAAVTGIAFAAEPPPFDLKKKPANEAERQARKAYMEKRMLEHTGGKIVQPGSLKGEIVYVNCQTRADKAWLEESAAYFRDQAKFNIRIADGGKFAFQKPQIQGNVSLFVVNDPALPALLVAPEDRWAVVNVAPLDNGKPAFFKARVVKELARGFSALCGAMNSSYPAALTGGVTKPGDLDEFSDARLPVDVIARFAPYLAPFGASPAVYSTYRSACKEGWAPAPTNDYQKAIFEKVQQEKSETLKGPKNPRKIEFDPKKGE